MADLIITLLDTSAKVALGAAKRAQDAADGIGDVVSEVDAARVAALAEIDEAGAEVIAEAGSILSSFQPINDEKLTLPSIHRPPATLADSNGNAALTFSQGWYVQLPYAARQAINAGLPIEFTVTKVSGDPEPAGNMRIYAGADFVLTRIGDELKYRGGLPTGTTTLQFIAQNSGSVTYGPVRVAVGGGITQPTDNASLVHVGAKHDAYDQVLPLTLNPLIYGAPPNFATTGKIELPAHSNAYWAIEILGDFVTGQPITIGFDCPLDLQTVVQAVGVFYANGDFGPATGHANPTLDYKGGSSYSVRDYFDPPPGAVKPTVIKMQWNNTTDSNFEIDNLRAYPSDTLPVHAKVPALITRAIEDRTILESGYGAWLVRVLIDGDSTYAPHFNANVRSIGYFLNLLLNSRSRVTEIGAQGANIAQILAANDLYTISTDVVGNFIPRDGSPFELANWTYAPITIHSLDNPQNACRFDLFGTECVFTGGVFGGGTGATPSKLYARAVHKMPRDVYVPTGSRLTLQQSRSASRDINIVQTSSVNGSLSGGDGAAFTAMYAARCAGRSADFIARTLARWIFCPAIAGVPAGTVPATQNVGSTTAVNSLIAAGCPIGNILDFNAPMGAPGSGTNGTTDREFLSVLEAQLLNAMLEYVKPTSGILFQQQKRSYRSDDFSSWATNGDGYHQNELYNCLRAIRIFLFPAFQACVNNPD